MNVYAWYFFIYFLFAFGLINDELFIESIGPIDVLTNFSAIAAAVQQYDIQYTQDNSNKGLYFHNPSHDNIRIFSLSDFIPLSKD